MIERSVGTPGLWIKIITRFPPRRSEWGLGVLTFGFGLVLLIEHGMFDRPQYVGFKALFGGQGTLGIVMLLVINGSAEKITPWIRVISALAGMVIWVGFFFMFTISGELGLWTAIFPVFTFLDAANIWSAATDAGEPYRVRVP